MRETVVVKISSDAAGAITLTPVVVQEMTIGELLDHIAGVCGKDEARIRQVIARGSLVSGGSRLRWEGWTVEELEAAALLARLPDPDPTRTLELEKCSAVIFCAGGHRLPVPREAVEKRRLLQRKSLWHTVESLARGAVYSGYSYKDRCDVYRLALSTADQAGLREAAELVSYSTLARQLSTLAFDAIELHIRR
jgi:hypothetical protein